MRKSPRKSRDLRAFVLHLSPLVFFVRESIKSRSNKINPEEKSALLALIAMIENAFIDQSFDIFDEDRRYNASIEEKERIKEINDSYRRGGVVLNSEEKKIKDNLNMESIRNEREDIQDPMFDFGGPKAIDGTHKLRRIYALQAQLLEDVGDAEESMRGFRCLGCAVINRIRRKALLSFKLVDLFGLDHQQDLDEYPLDDICKKLHPDDLAWVADVVKLPTACGEIRVMEYRVKDISGDYRLIHDISATASVDKQMNAAEIVSIMIDYTEYRNKGKKRFVNPNLSIRHN